MALVPDFRKDTVSADGTYSYLVDHTVYGGANPLRTDLALAMKAYKVDESLVETAMTVATYTPTTVTQWTITNTIDGWVKFYVVLVNKYTTTVGPTSNLYDLVYDTTTSKYYTYISSTPAPSTVVTDPSRWSVNSDPTGVLRNIGLSNQTNNISYQILSSINTFQTEKCFNAVTVTLAREECDCGCDTTNTSRTSKLFSKLFVLLTAAKVDDIQQKYIEGERACATALNYCNQWTNSL